MPGSPGKLGILGGTDVGFKFGAAGKDPDNVGIAGGPGKLGIFGGPGEGIGFEGNLGTSSDPGKIGIAGGTGKPGNFGGPGVAFKLGGPAKGPDKVGMPGGPGKPGRFGGPVAAYKFGGVGNGPDKLGIPGTPYPGRVGGSNCPPEWKSGTESLKLGSWVPGVFCGIFSGKVNRFPGTGIPGIGILFWT